MTAMREWLASLGLGQYADTFDANGIDWEVLLELDEADLEKVGIILGHRKKLLKAIDALEADLNSAPKSAPSRDAERRQLTVMFVDLVGSTALSGALDPENYREVMRGYQDACAGIAARYEGHVAKFLGDGVLIYFGYPSAHEDDAERAVRAGLEIVRAVSAVEAGNEERLEARIGVATGLVVAGDLVGAQAREDDAVLGETPNLAARLQTLAEPGTMVVSGATKQILGTAFGLEDLGTHRLKGMAVPVPAWRVVGARAVESRFEAAHDEALTEFIGRDAELDLLLQRWRQAEAGEGQVVQISGEAGIGKSRIVQMLRDRLADDEHTRLRYQCLPYYTSTAYYAFISQIERAAGIAPDDTTNDKLDKLETLLALSTEHVKAAAPLFAALLLVPSGDRYDVLELTSQELKARTVEVLLEQLFGLAVKAPVLMIFEDAHWVDPSSLEVLAQVVQRIDQSRVLVVITSRPEFAPPWPNHSHMTVLTLNRLSREQSGKVIERVALGKSLPKAVTDEIVSKTDGVPLFVEELTKTVLELGLLREEGESYILTGPLPPLAIPSTLQDSLMARLDRLASVKEVAQLGAAIGREFSYALLADIAGWRDELLEDALRQLVDAEIIFRRGSGAEATYIFKHALVQDAAYESMLLSTRQQLHLRIAHALEERFGERVETAPEVLAHHFTEAGVHDKAIESWRRAGELASSRSANIEAEAHLGRGLAIIDALPDGAVRDRAELELLLLLGSVLIQTHGWAAPEIGEVYARADTLCQRLNDKEHSFTVAWGLWFQKQQSAQFDKAVKIAGRLLDIAEGEGNTEHTLQAHHSAWTSCFTSDEIDSVIDHTEVGLQLYDKALHHSHVLRFGGHDPGVCCRILGGLARLIAGRPEQGRNLTIDSVALGRELAHPFSLAYALSFSATSHLLLEEPENVSARMEELSRVVDDHGFAPIKPNMAMLTGWSRIAMDGDSRAIELVESGFADLEKTGLKRLSFQLYLLADAYRRLGSDDAALRAVNRAAEIADSTNERRWEAEIYRLKGTILAANCSADKAEQSLLRALASARGQGAKWFELRAAIDLARHWGKHGKASEVENLLKPIYGDFTEGFETRNLRDARALIESY